jgi:hypothetical protein
MVRLHTLELDHQFAIDPLHLRELNASEQVFVADKINAFLGTSASRFPPHVNRLDLKITYMNEVLQARGIAPIRRLA